MRGSIYTIFLTVVLLSVTSNATLRYVSKTGSSIPPYTSWETASDSIRKCIDVSVAGDTIFVGPGTYSELFDMKPGIALIGAGMDSTIIDTREIDFGERYTVIELKNENVIEGFHFDISKGREQALFLIDDCNEKTKIRFNKISNLNTVANTYQTDVIISDNVIYNISSVFRSASFNHQNSPLFSNNYISNADKGIEMTTYSNPVIRNNVFNLNKDDDGLSFLLWSNDSLVFSNNLVIDEDQDRAIIAFTEGYGSITNNIFQVYSTDFVISFSANFHCYNNFIMESNKGFHTIEGDASTVGYNNIWNVDKPASGFILDTTNIFEDPMFINKQDKNFQLQKYSPMVDAGHPDILDKDGTRSDIGLFGGPYGEVYTYKDCAPKAPEVLIFFRFSDHFKISLRPNTEKDFSHFMIYASYKKDFVISENTLLTRLDTTVYSDYLPDESIYLKITSVDNQENESIPGEEIEIKLTGLNEAQTSIADYRLYQNYPNPFNPSTLISYTLKKPGYITLKVYDIKGEKIVTLAEGLQNAGYHELEFNGKQHPQDAGIASGIYLYSLEVKSNKNIPVFRETLKMIMLK